jgi:hypothetical protein
MSSSVNFSEEPFSRSAVKHVSNSLNPPERMRLDEGALHQYSGTPTLHHSVRPESSTSTSTSPRTSTTHLSNA